MKRLFLVTFFVLMIFACSDEPMVTLSGDWLIPKSEVYDGGPGKDGIPALLNPLMRPILQTEYVLDNDLVVVYKNGNDVVIYPHKILDWHEIINNDVGDKSITLSYCPLTGSAIGLNRTFPDLNGNLITSTFGVSGLLYNSNLILYDRKTDSYWSQMKNQCVGGDLSGVFPVNEILVETSYGTARALYPQALVISDETDVYVKSRYQIYPYGDYKSSDRITFPISNSDDRLTKKERVLGVLNNSASKVYRFREFKFTTGIIMDEVGGEPVIVVGDSNMKFMVAYKAHLSDGVQLAFSANKSGEKVFSDNKGNTYNLFGEVVSGPDSGERLEAVHSYIAFWFAWAAFYPQSDIYNL